MKTDNDRIRERVFILKVLIVILMLLAAWSVVAQPPDPCGHPACDTPNPPWWCEGPCNPVPINGMWILILGGAILGGVYYYRITNKVTGE